MLTFKAIGLQHWVIQPRKQPLEKILCVPVSPCQAMFHDDLEDTETLGTVFIYSVQTENRQRLQLNTLQKHNFFLPPLGMGKPQEGQKVSLDFFPPHSTKKTANAETVLPDLESWGQNRPGRSGQSSRCSHFSIMRLPAHAATRQKCLQHTMSMLPPPPAQQPALPQARQGSPHYPTGQDKSIPDRPGHEQTAVTAAHGQDAAPHHCWQQHWISLHHEEFSPSFLHSRTFQPIQDRTFHTEAGSTSCTSQRAVLPRHCATAHRHAQANSVCNGTVQG